MPQVALEIPVDHPAFAGHFPGRPIVPGVTLLDAAQRVIESAEGLTLAGISVAKFHSPVGPGEALTVDYTVNSGAVRFEIRCGPRKVADGRFTLLSIAIANTEPATANTEPVAEKTEQPAP